MELINNIEDNQYEFHIEGKVAFLEYVKSNDRIFLTHTEVPKSLGGQGIGTALIKKVLEKIDKEHELPIVPLCPFVAAYIKKHPEWKSLVFKGVRIE